MEVELEQITALLLKDFVETAPLHLERRYRQQVGTKRNDLWVGEMESYCDKCEQSRPFHTTASRGSGARGSGASVAPPADLKTGINSYSFRCASCSSSLITIFVRYEFKDTCLHLTKCGEYPRKRLDRDSKLDSFLPKDKDLLESATVLMQNGYGIGAFAYLRQIVERNITALIDLIREDVSLGGDSTDQITALEELKESSPMKEKIKIANRALPDYLKPGGANPLGRLYESLSEGIHSLTDEECLRRAKVIFECLKYLVGELSDRKLRRDQFASVVGNIPHGADQS